MVKIAYLQGLRRLSRDVRLNLVSSVIIGFSYFGLYSVLFNLYLLRLGYGPEFIGLVNAVGFLTNAAFSLPAGALGARWGSWRMVIAGMGVLVVTGALIPLAQFMPPPVRATWLLVTFPLAWLGAALLMVNSAPFVMGITAPEERNHAFSAQMALSPLAGFAGSLVAGLLPGLLATILGLSRESPASYGYPLFIAPVLYGVALLALLATRDVTVEQERGTSAEAGQLPIPYGLILLIALFVLLESSGEWGARVFLNVYLDDGLQTPSSLIGAVLAVGQLLAVPAALVMPLVVTRLGRSRTVIWSAFYVACSVLLLAFIPHWVAAGVGFIGVGAMTCIMFPAYTIYYQEMIPVRWRTVASGAVSMAAGLGSSAMVFGGGYIIKAIGYRSLFLMSAALVASSALLFWIAFRVPRGELGHTSTLMESG